MQSINIQVICCTVVSKKTLRVANRACQSLVQRREVAFDRSSQKGDGEVAQNSPANYNARKSGCKTRALKKIPAKKNRPVHSILENSPDNY